MDKEIYAREDFILKKPVPTKSILKKPEPIRSNLYKPGKKRLFFKLNSIIYTNGDHELLEENPLVFIPKPYHLVNWRGVDRKKLVLGDEVIIDIEAEKTDIPTFCEFLIVKNGAAKQLIPRVIVRDAGIQIDMDKKITLPDSYSPQRSEPNDKKNVKFDQSQQTDVIQEPKIELTPKPSEDKSVGTDDILDSLDTLKDYSIKDLMSTSSLENNKIIKSDILDSKIDKRYRENGIKKVEEKSPLTNIKRVNITTNFYDLNKPDNYEEYLVRDCSADTEDLTRYFNFENYTFDDFLSGKIKIQVKKKEDEIFKLIDIKITGPVKLTSEIGTITDEVKNLVKESRVIQTQTETKKVEIKKYTPKIEIKAPPPPKKITRSSFNDLISSIDKKLEVIKSIAETNRVEFDSIVKEDLDDKLTNESSQCHFDHKKKYYNVDKQLENHIEKYYNSSTKRYPLISRAIENKRLKASPVYNSLEFGKEFYCSSYNDNVDYTNSFKSCPICCERHSKRSKLSSMASLSNFDNLVKSTNSIASNGHGYKNYAHEYLIENSVIIDDDSETFDVNRYQRRTHDKSLSMYHKKLDETKNENSVI